MKGKVESKIRSEGILSNQTKFNFLDNKEPAKVKKKEKQVASFNSMQQLPVKWEEKVQPTEQPDVEVEKEDAKKPEKAILMEPVKEVI